MGPEHEDATTLPETADVSGYAGQLTMQTMLDIAAGQVVIVKSQWIDHSMQTAHLAMLTEGPLFQMFCDYWGGWQRGLLPVTSPMLLCYDCQRVQAGYLPPED